MFCKAEMMHIVVFLLYYFYPVEGKNEYLSNAVDQPSN